MSRVSRIVLAACLMVGAMVGRVSFAAQDHAPETQQIALESATRGAEDWMAMIDAGRYAESWKASSEIVKNAVTMEKFESSMKTVREPMGKHESRKLQNASYTTQLPGVPPGEYVMILYDSSFEHKVVAQETVVMTREKDKVWRMAGYHIK